MTLSKQLEIYPNPKLQLTLTLNCKLTWPELTSYPNPKLQVTLTLWEPSTFIPSWPPTYFGTVDFHASNFIPFDFPRTLEDRPVSLLMDFRSTVHTFVDRPLYVFSDRPLWPRSVYFWSFWPSNFTKLDRPLSPKTVHFHLDPVLKIVSVCC